MSALYYRCCKSLALISTTPLFAAHSSHSFSLLPGIHNLLLLLAVWQLLLLRLWSCSCISTMARSKVAHQPFFTEVLKYLIWTMLWKPFCTLSNSKQIEKKEYLVDLPIAYLPDRFWVHFWQWMESKLMSAKPLPKQRLCNHCLATVTSLSVTKNTYKRAGPGCHYIRVYA